MGWQSSRDRKGNDFVKSLPLPFVDHSFTCPLPALCRPVTRPQWWGRAADPIMGVRLGLPMTLPTMGRGVKTRGAVVARSEEHTSELQSRENIVCRLLLEKKTNR